MLKSTAVPGTEVPVLLISVGRNLNLKADLMGEMEEGEDTLS